MKKLTLKRAGNLLRAGNKKSLVVGLLDCRVALAMTDGHDEDFFCFVFPNSLKALAA
jgi:hypothetical protein